MAGGVVAPEDLVYTGYGFGSQHLPGGAGVAWAGGRAHEGDQRRRRASSGIRLAITTAQQSRVALVFKRGVVIEDRAYNTGRGADAVTATGGQGEGDGFIGLN